jgi:4-amino-4-deoxy-L-arabinose transferase-like glycosyltransferase
LAGVRGSMRSKGGTAFWAVVVVSACAAVYLLLYLLNVHGRAMGANTTGDEPHYLITATSILRDGDLCLLNNYDSGSFQQEGYFDFDELPPHLAEGRDGRPVPWHSVFVSVVILPGYAIFGWRGAGVTMILLTCGSALIVFLLLRRFLGAARSGVLTLVFFLTYPLVVYSHMIYPEVIAMFLLIAGTWTAVRVREGGGWVYAAGCGACAGLLPLLHAKFLVLTAALVLLAVICFGRRRREMLSFSAPLLAAAIFLVVWTWYLFGPDIIGGLTVTGGEEGIFGSPWGVFGLYLDRVWGLLPYAPLYIAFFAGLPLPTYRRGLLPWRVFIPFTVVAYSAAVGLFRDWMGGTAPVPRYLVVMLPLLAICAAVAMGSAKKLWAKTVLALLAASQVVLTVFALIFPLGTYAVPTTDNNLYHHFLGNNFLSAGLERIFPLLHPAPVSSAAIAQVAAWCVFIALLVYARRWYLSPPAWTSNSGYRPGNQKS